MTINQRYTVDFHWRLGEMFTFPPYTESTVWLGLSNRFEELDIHLGPVVITVWKLRKAEYWG